MNDCLSIADTAHAYLSADLCVLPARRTEKRPAVRSWKQYQKKMPTVDEVSAWFANTQDGLCLICGDVSGAVEMIDFDGGGELFSAWWDRIPAELRDRLVVETTPSGGMHVIYRCEIAVCGNLKLAQRKDDEKVITLIETRGEGGLFLCAPTPGYILAHGDLCNLPVLTKAERDTLLQAAWELNEYLPPVIGSTPAHGDVAQPATGGSTDRPGDDFNARGDVRALLTEHGWTLAQNGENEYWRRPGKMSGWSATLKEHSGGSVFYVFSSNAEPFESNRAYSPFSVYALLNCGGDFEQAARSLRQLGYGNDDTPEIHSNVDISGIVCASTNNSDHVSDTSGDIDPGVMPFEMLRVPGFIGEVMDHCLKTAPYPNPVMAFCGALSLLAFLAGRKVRDSGDNRTNIYLLGLAHSSAGKDWPRKINTSVLHKVGMADSLGERFASGEGIQDALFQSPSMLFQTDEIDGMLQSINKSKDARHEAIMSTLLTMHSSSNSVYPMRRKAGTPGKSGKSPPGVIDQPCLVIFGTAIPNHYYEALSERMLTNGFFARMIILEAGKRGSGQEPSICDLPPRVLETAKWWTDYRPGTGNLQDWHPVPTVITYTDEAKRLLIETREEAEAEYAKAEAGNDSVGTTVWGRVSEQTRKLALLYAISENYQSPHINLVAVQWASQFVIHQTRRMLFMAQSHVADGEFDALIKRTITILKKWHEKNNHDVPMPGWELRRRLKQRPSDFKDIVFELTERRIAEFVTECSKTKPKSGYRLL